MKSITTLLINDMINLKFLKGRNTSEVKFFTSLKTQGYPVEVLQCGTPDFILGKPTNDDIKRAKDSLELVKSHFLTCKCSNDSYSSDKNESVDKSSSSSSSSEENSKEPHEKIDSNKCPCPYDVFVLDEIMTCIDLDMISVKDIIDLLQVKPSHVELILTGSCDSKKAEPLIQSPLVGLVTEMKEIRHYYKEKKLDARVGIEM